MPTAKHDWTGYVPPNPSGLCKCGCGERTSIAPRNDAVAGVMKGDHYRYRQNHVWRSLPDYVIEDRGAPTPCWIWRTAADAGRKKLTSEAFGDRMPDRVVWEKERGPLLLKQHLIHTCGQRACVNPDHMRLVHEGGEEFPYSQAKLTEQDVREIRASQGTVSVADLVKRYGVSKTSIKAVLNRETWKHVE